MQEESSESSSSILREFLDFLIFALCVRESFFRYAAASAAYFLGPVLCSIAPNLLIYWGHSILERGISYTGGCSFVLFTFLPFCVRLRKVLKGFWVSTMWCYFWSRIWTFGRIINIAVTLLLLLEAAASVREAAASSNVSFYKVFILKNIPAER